MEKTILICLSLTFITGLCQGQDGLFPPGPVYGAVGDKVLFTTTITPSSSRLLSVSWTFNTVIIINSSATNITGPAYSDRITLDIYTGTLELRNLTLGDSGSYQLITENPMGITQQDQTTLDVFEKISGVSLTGQAKPLIEDQNSAFLICEGTGSNITREWMKDGQPLSPSNNIIFSPDNRSVSISPVRRSDSGEYQCRLSNPVSSDTATYTMTVNYGPYEAVIQGVKTLVAGTDLVLFCSAPSVPLATVSWTGSGQTAENSPVLVREAGNLSRTNYFTCTAYNNITAKTASITHTVTVTDPEVLSPGAAAGVAVGVILGVELLAVAVFLLIRHYGVNLICCSGRLSERKEQNVYETPSRGQRTAEEKEMESPPSQPQNRPKMESPPSQPQKRPKMPTPPRDRHRRAEPIYINAKPPIPRKPKTDPDIYCSTIE